MCGYKKIKIESSMYSKNQSEYERQNSPKNLSSIRTIIIGNTLATELKKWKTEQLTLRVLYGTRNNKPNLDFVFTRFEKTKFKEIAVLQPTVQLIFTKINKKHETFVVKKKKRHRICLDVAFLRIKYTILRISVRYSSSESSSFILWNTF